MLYESLKFHQNPLVHCKPLGHYSILCKFWACSFGVVGHYSTPGTLNYPAYSPYFELLILVTQF